MVRKQEEAARAARKGRHQGPAEQGRTGSSGHRYLSSDGMFDTSVASERIRQAIACLV